VIATVPTFHTTCHHIPLEHNFHIQYSENHISYKSHISHRNGLFFFTEWKFSAGPTVNQDSYVLRNIVGASLLGVTGTFFGPYVAAGAGIGAFAAELVRGTVT
jgi:hypothetical protein